MSDFDPTNPHSRAALARIADAPVLSDEERERLITALPLMSGSAAAAMRMRLGYSASAEAAANTLSQTGA